MATKRQNELYRQTFNKVIRVYLELKSVSGSLSCAATYRFINQHGSSRTTYNSSIISPTVSDFLCDVDKIMLRELSNRDFVLIRNAYLHNDKSEEWRLNKHRIQEILGKRFIKDEIHPVEGYFKSKDTR